jgi:hypothetical protein
VAGRVRGAFFSTRLRRLPLTARRAARVLSHKGRAGSLLHRLGHKACGLLAATRERPGFESNPSILRDGPSALLRMRGERRAEKRNPYGSVPVAGHGGRLSARHTRRWSAAGPALRCRRNAGRSASSWQGLIVVPEGAPSRPGALACETRPAGAAPHPAFTTPRDDAPQRMRWPECKGGAAGGDKFSLRHTGESRYPVRRDAEGIYHHRRLHGLLDARLRGHDND